jgi:PEP-CTERM motif
MLAQWRFVLTNLSVATLALLLGGAAPVQAGPLINVDFNTTFSPTYSGAGVLGAAGDFWNGTTASGPPVNVTNVPLLNSAGAATSVQLSYSSPDSLFDVGSDSIFQGTQYEALLRDYLFADNSNTGRGAGTVLFTGLTPGDTYRLILYSVANVASRTTVFTVGGATQDVVPTLSPILTLGVNFADFTTTADALGQLSITLTAGSSTSFQEADLNGIQLQDITPPPSATVPEPSSLVLLTIGGMALAGWRRIRKRSTAQV